MTSNDVADAALLPFVSVTYPCNLLMLYVPFVGRNEHRSRASFRNLQSQNGEQL
ncbi:hypothetical protein M378DRAFT_154864, partial [Amanita muscaria Koide BX008]